MGDKDISSLLCFHIKHYIQFNQGRKKVQLFIESFSFQKNFHKVGVLYFIQYMGEKRKVFFIFTL